MKTLGTIGPTLGLGLTLLVTACSGGAGGTNTGTFGIVSCSLGCSSPGGGPGQISCGVQDVFVNGELRFDFNAPVQLSSVDVFSFQVIEFATGKTPAATFLLSKSDKKSLVWRPLLTFDSTGNPIFGLVDGSSYTIKIPGVVEDPGGPYIKSKSGQSNRHRLLCTVDATLGVLDVSPGAPRVDVFVLVAEYDAVCGTPTGTITEFLANAGPVLQDVKSDTTIRMEFNDVMNPGTLVNPVTGESATIDVVIDPDGITSDPTDQQAVLGTFTIDLDQDALKTTVIFTPELGFPSAGFSLATKRKIVVKLSTQIADLGGNPLSNAGNVIFQPECFEFPQTTLVESFDDNANEDTGASGGTWALGGLATGVGGGNGRLGALTLAAGETLTLSTDNEDFLDDMGAPLDPAIYDPSSILDPTTFGTAETITDGIFEFSHLQVAGGAVLRFEGVNPARLFVRGELRVGGRLDLSGGDGDPEWDATQDLGQQPTVPGPAGGAGGEGGRLPTWIGFESVAGTIIGMSPPPTLAELDGSPGSGVPDNLLTPTGTFGGGQGGQRWPSVVVDPQGPGVAGDYFMPSTPQDITGVAWDFILFCQTKMIGGSAGGGAHALDGAPSLNKALGGGGLVAPLPPDVNGGDAALLGLDIGSDPDSDPRKLNPDDGYLVGGAGGGGGGSSIAGTNTNGQLFINCLTVFGGGAAEITLYNQRSAAAGGAGGGAVQAQAGRRVVIDGVLDASGGDGGGFQSTFEKVSASGGGGGGGTLIQSQAINIAALPGRVNVSGGAEGRGPSGTRGGKGGAGLVRMEAVGSLPTVPGESIKIAPSPTDLAAAGATPDDILSIGTWDVVTSGPGASNGSQSCWMRPDGAFFLLDFLEDDGSDLGWDMDVLLGGLGEFSYRGENPFFRDSLEETFGSDLGAAPMLIRFQGARAIKKIDDLCDVELYGPDSVIFPGSLTGWVRHPEELNDFFGTPALRPNMVRFQVVYDRSQVGFGSITGITEIRVEVQPD